MISLRLAPVFAKILTAQPRLSVHSFQCRGAGGDTQLWYRADYYTGVLPTPLDPPTDLMLRSPIGGFSVVGVANCMSQRLRQLVAIKNDFL